MILEYIEQKPAGQIPNTLEYVVDGEVVTVTYRTYEYGTVNEETGEKEVVVATEATDTFDFTGVPDGVLGDVETTLPVEPIVSGEKVNGTLTLTVLDWSNANG